MPLKSLSSPGRSANRHKQERRGRLNKSESKYFNTAEKMRQALIAVLETKPFEYITIKEICEKAGVNRSTFYLHYENTRDLLEETTDSLLEQFLSYFSVDLTVITRRFADCDLAELNFISKDYLYPYLSYIKENRSVFRTALAHSKSFGFDSVYQRMFEHIFDPILDRFGYPAGERKYVMMFYLNGMEAIIIEWLKDGCDKSIEEIAAIMDECVFGRREKPVL